MAVLGGLIAALGGVVLAYTGFSAPAMNLNLDSGVILLVWVASYVARAEKAP